MDASDYAPFYCEENVWKLLLRPEYEASESYAVLVFADPPPVWVCGQRAGSGPAAQVAWDYHVFALSRHAGAGQGAGYFVWDWDTLFGFPCAAPAYLDAAFLARDGVLFRVVPRAVYLRQFASNRSHMLSATEPSAALCWHAPPPEWQPIRGVDATSDHTLPEFLDATRNEPERLGRLRSLSAFGHFVSTGEIVW
jgi:N-terminal glutamine amidase